ncbi:MAG: transglutaminase-like domain-containing protein [bacterium]
MKQILIFTFLIAFYSNAFSQTSKTVDFEIKYELISKGKTDKIEFICLIAQDIVGIQTIKEINFSLEPNNVFFENGNKYAKFVIIDPAKKEKIKISYTLEIYHNDFATRVEHKEILLDSNNNYLSIEKFIEIDDEQIRRKAEELRGNQTIETLKNIYLFVNENISYSGFNPNDLGAKAALENKAGDCSEFSDLFVALCRINNIPARVIGGYTVDFENTPKHNWVQVYLKNYGWISFDPTPGNSSSFSNMENRYIQISNVRNDKILSNYHNFTYLYWGDPIEVKEYFE